ncbi:TonB family protein [Dyadobacter jejuensis]|uniref:TonB family protein n=1 Tax=Dyadobacter jejuensis TaxID=1082580 RepID=A0A316AI83_9BACT|nr:TonB family protein [Dyadobacter jejuensis]PWJ56580.1 TonB family protein [Dyadobacter jejuensis]
MKLTGIILGLLACQLSYGQGVLEAQQTDSPAVPAGGMERLGAYVLANLQLPIASAAQGLDGRVFVQGTVEPDGRMTDLQVLRSMSPEVDREVVRVLSLYKAWKPAVKAGAPVRQKVVYPAYIRTEAIPGYDGQEGVLIEYFNKKNEATRVASDIKYRNYIPVDALGHARSNLLYQQKKGDGWKTIKTVPFSKDTSWVHLAGAADSLLAIVTSTKETMVGSPYEKITRSVEGELLAFEAFDGKAAMPLLARYYYPNGSIRRLYQRQESLVQRTDWYENGQIWSMVRVSENLQADADREALRIIKLMEGKWEPALYKGRAIAAPMRIPINFQVN